MRHCGAGVCVRDPRDKSTRRNRGIEEKKVAANGNARIEKTADEELHPRQEMDYTSVRLGLQCLRFCFYIHMCAVLVTPMDANGDTASLFNCTAAFFLTSVAPGTADSRMTYIMFLVFLLISFHTTKQARGGELEQPQ